MVVKNLQEAYERIVAAMQPQKTGGNFAPGIQQLRQSAGNRRQLNQQRPTQAT